MTKTPKKPEKTKVKVKAAKAAETKNPPENKPEKKEEFGGRGGPDPTRYGDWEIGGKCVDF